MSLFNDTSFTVVYTNVVYTNVILFLEPPKKKYICFYKNYAMLNLSQEEWTAQKANDSQPKILDVRTPEEYEEGYIPDAQNIDIRMGQGFLDALKELDTSVPYYVYCRSGARSNQACQLMSQLGFEKVYNLEGGILDWEGEVVS